MRERLFREVGCEDAKDGSAIYSSHSFRTICDSLLSRNGMDRKFVDLTIGHKAALGANIAYKDWAEVEKQWKERCMERMTIEKPVVVEVTKEIVDSKARKQNEFLIRLLWDKMTDEEKAAFISMSPFSESLKKKLASMKQLEDKSADTQADGNTSTESRSEGDKE